MEDFVPEKEIVSPIDQLLDENNEEPITLYDENDNPHQFDQIAVIPLDGKLYAILVPLFEIEGYRKRDRGSKAQRSKNAGHYRKLCTEVLGSEGRRVLRGGFSHCRHSARRIEQGYGKAG